MTDGLSPAVFLDRDGTIIEDRDYCSSPSDVKIFPGVTEALRRLKSKGFKLIIITNQSGIGRRLFTREQYRAVEAEVLRQVGESLIAANYFCPHMPDQFCSCRKPARVWPLRPRWRADAPAPPARESEAYPTARPAPEAK